MFGSLFLALGLSASIGASALMPQKSVNPSYSNIVNINNTQEGSNIWVDKFNNSVSYDILNAVYTVSISYGWGYEEGITFNEFSDYPIGRTTGEDGYRGFFISNGEDTPTFSLDSQSNEYTYNLPQTNNYLRLDFIPSSDNIPIGFKLITGGYITSSSSFNGAKYFQNGYMILVDMVSADSQASLYRTIVSPSNWTSNSSGTQYVYTRDYLDFELWEYINLRFTLVPISSNQGYDNGYEYGYDAGVDSGFSTGYTSGYNDGFAEGLNGYNWFSLLGSIADTPILMLRSLFDWELFGIPLLSVILTLITALFVLYILKKVF